MDRKPSPKPRYDLIKSFVNDEVFLIPRWLPQKYLANCILVSDRAELLRRLPRQGVVAEIGTQRGDFAKQILEICEPRELHVFDLSFRDFDRAFFDAAISQRQVILHEGDSSTEMTKLPDGAFDWIYIDGDHTFEGVLRDIREAKRLIKPNGFLVFNDYTNYSPLEQMQYGVMRAVNDLCIDGDFEIVIFALSALGYHDVALRRRSLLPDSREELSGKPWNSARVPNEIYEVKEMLGDEERRDSTIKMELADFAKRCWETGRKIELTGGYGESPDLNGTVFTEPASYYYFLAGVAKEARALRIIEIGAWWGGSTLAMLAGGRVVGSPTVVSLDLEHRNLAHLKSQAGIFPIEGDCASRETISKVKELLGTEPIDLLYVDSAHNYEGTLQHFAIYQALYRPRIVIFDDIHLSEPMNAVWSDISACYGIASLDLDTISTDIRPGGEGFGMIWLQRDLRPADL